LVELTVRDEGVGFSSNDSLRRPGIGLQIVQALVN
jgi:two-component sensor histidine kinase